MKKAGVTLNVDYVEYATWRSIVYDPESLIKRGYNWGFASWAPGTGDTAYTLSSVLHTRGGGYGRFNSGGYSNKEVDRLIENARSGKSSKETGKLLGKAQQIIFDEAALLFLHYDPNVFACRSKVKGVSVTPNGIMLWGYANKD
jgi:ABC-type transport system substrate-binding protein